MTSSDADRCYEAWKEAPTEETLVALYKVILARARRYASSSNIDYTVAYDLASDLTLALRDGYRPKIKKTFGVWLDVRLRTDCIDAVRARQVESERQAPLECAAEIAAPSTDAITVPIAALRGVDRRIVVLYLRGYTLNAISQKLSIPRATVHWRMKKLKKTLEKPAV